MGEIPVIHISKSLCYSSEGQCDKDYYTLDMIVIMKLMILRMMMVIIMTTMMIATMMMMMMLGRGSVIRTITPHMMAVRPTFDGKTYHGGNTKQRKRLFSPCRKKGTS